MQHHDFTDMVLYIQPGDANCETALRSMNNMAGNIHVENVSDLPRPLPPWLNGIPTLVVKSEQQAYRGTACLNKIRDAASTSWAGAGSGDTYIGGFVDGSSMACKATSSFHDVPMYNDGGGGGPGGPGPGGPGGPLEPQQAERGSGNHIEQNDVEAYMRARGPAQQQQVVA